MATLVAATSVVGCSGPARRVPEPVATPAASADCEDEHEGPLHAPSFDSGYLITRNELAQRTLDHHKGELLRCWTERAIHDPDIAGRCTATFHIDQAGHAHGIRTRGFDPDIDHCICLRIAAIQFPTYAEGAVTVPFAFPSTTR